MANVWGLDVEAVRKLGTDMSREAGEIQRIVSTLNSVIQNTQWTGPDAERFRGDWQQIHSKALLAAQRSLEETSLAAKQNAEAQDRISNS